MNLNYGLGWHQKLFIIFGFVQIMTKETKERKFQTKATLNLCMFFDWDYDKEIK